MLSLSTFSLLIFSSEICDSMLSYFVFRARPHSCLQDNYGAAESPTNPSLASQGINAGFLGSSRVDSSAIGEVDDDDFEDALEDPVSNSFTTAAVETGTGAGQPHVSQPYVSQTGPPVVDTRNDPDETFGPVKNRDQSAQNEINRGSSAFGDDDEYEGTPGKKGLRAKVKGKFGSKKEHHQEKKRNKADQELQHKMQEKEMPKARAVTVGNTCVTGSACYCLPDLPCWTCCLGCMCLCFLCCVATYNANSEVTDV